MAKAPKSFAPVARGYANLWKKCELTKPKQAKQIAERIISCLPSYTPITEATGVPGWVIGILHYREGNLNFGTYLGNGQSLSKKTTIVPKGRGPFLGKGAFVRGAIDALELQRFNNIKDWSAARFLYESERFNGFGYFMKGVNSPYVWGGTSLQQPGKYVGDGVFDRSVIDTQLGSAAILKALCELSPEINAQVNKVPAVSPAPAPVIPPSTDPLTKFETSGKTAAEIAKERDMADTAPVTVDTKPAYEMKTIITNVVGAVAAVAAIWGFNLTPDVQGYIVTGIVIVWGVASSAFRATATTVTPSVAAKVRNG